MVNKYIVIVELHVEATSEREAERLTSVALHGHKTWGEKNYHIQEVEKQA